MRVSKTKLHIFLWIILGMVAFLCASGVGVVFKWNACSESPDGAELLGTEPPDEKVILGEPVSIHFRIRAPWARSISDVEPVPAPGSQLVGEPEVRLEKIGWGYTVRTISLKIQAYRNGVLRGGKLQIVLEGGSEGKQRIDTEIPELNAKALDVAPSDSPVIAGKVDLTQKKTARWVWYLIGIVLAGLAALILWYFRSGRSRRIVPPWERALNAIFKVRENLRTGHLDASGAIIELTDVIRHYFEERFLLRAERQTTREFLDALEQGEELAEPHRKFLREFLSSADLVKFAQAPANIMLFDEAADKAETLVNETRIPEQPEENDKEKS